MASEQPGSMEPPPTNHDKSAPGTPIAQETYDISREDEIMEPPPNNRDKSISETPIVEDIYDMPNEDETMEDTNVSEVGFVKDFLDTLGALGSDFPQDAQSDFAAGGLEDSFDPYSHNPADTPMSEIHHYPQSDFAVGPPEDSFHPYSQDAVGTPGSEFHQDAQPDLVAGTFQASFDPFSRDVFDDETQVLIRHDQFKIPNGADVIDLDDYVSTGVAQAETERLIKKEPSPDILMHDEDVVRRSTSNLPNVDDRAVSNEMNASEVPLGGLQGAETTSLDSPNVDRQVPSGDVRNVTADADRQGPADQAGNGMNNPSEAANGVQQPSRTLKIIRRLLHTPKEKNPSKDPANDPSTAAQIHQERNIKAWEALTRRTAREDGDLPYPSPHAQSGTTDMNEGEPVFDEGPMIGSDTEPEVDPKFTAAKRNLERRKKHNIATVEDDIAFRKFEVAEKLRVQRIKARRDFEERDKEQSLFVNQENAGVLLDHANESSDEGVHPNKRPADNDQSDQEPPKKRKTTKAHRKQNRIPAQELRDSIAVGMEAEIARDKKCKKSTKAPAKKDAKSNKAKGKEPKKRGRPKKGPQMTNIKSLYNINVIDAATANRDKDAQPGFNSTVKATALSELIASIPEEERKTATADKNALLDATKKFSGYRAMKADGQGGWRLKGMKSSLYHYQLLGAAFMRDRENGSERPYGGFQADEMGFGKTVMMIANILDGKPTAEDPCRTTLIVASPMLATQWLNEITKHVEPGAMGEVIKYHSGNRIASADIVKTLQKCDVIITTYHEVLRSYPHCKPPLHLVTEAQKNAWWQKHYEEEVGALHKIFFRRIVLDEAQAIKNAESKTSIAVRGLNGKYRWAISGTPIQNTVEEFFPYFRYIPNAPTTYTSGSLVDSFLKVKHTGSIETFRQNYVTKKDTIGMERLHGLLRTMMIRRTHLDTIFGRPILRLPDIEKKTIEVEFNPLERHIYNVVKSRFCLRINAFSKAGVLDSNYRHIFSMMLALRQLTGHVLLVQRVLKDILQLEDIEALMVMTADEMDSRKPHAATLKELRNIILKHNKKPLPAPQAEQEARTPRDKDTAKTPPKTPEGEEEVDIGRGFGTTFRFRKCLRALRDSSKWEELTSRSLCHHCLQPPEEPMVTSCLHLYCKECLNSIAFEASKNGQDRAACKECGQVFEESRLCEGIKELSFAGDPRTPRDREESIVSVGRPQKNVRSPRNQKEDEDDGSDWISGLPGHMLPSSKCIALKMQVLEWLKAEPDCKVLVFTQFLDMIRILSRICNNEEWGWCQFTGKMNFDARDKAIKDFRDDPSKKLLLCSLKAGGIGLNLTMASKVIILDLYWNECVEQQAFCRAFRIGQEKMVEVVRFVVRNSIDTDMVRMQERKTKEINLAIGESEKSTRYTVQELMRLFGPVREDEYGQEFIWVQDEEEQSDVQDDTDVANHLPPRPF